MYRSNGRAAIHALNLSLASLKLRELECGESKLFEPGCLRQAHL